ncbi:uncharacterized protein [Musca autumnalis]|uniref:uncharacterized protein n=1 Tax=Musca autumnalis TaxID=221902 RepID=UPI003CE713E5
MSQTILCRLCVEICNQYKALCDEKGESNDVYETTVKYFDPMLLNLDQGKQPVICIVCWRHIDDFNNFQMSVILAQSKLSKYSTHPVESEPMVKAEDDVFIEPDLELKENAENDIPPYAISAESNDNNADNDYDKDFIGFPEVDTFEEQLNISFSSDDEKPLLECIKAKSKGRKKTSAETKKKEGDTVKVPKKRGRKPKADSKKAAKTKTTKGKVSTDADLEMFLEGLKVKQEEDGADDTAQSNDEGDTSKTSNTPRRTSKEIDDFIAKWKQDLDCYLCNATAPNMMALRQHFRKEHPKQKCYVLCCQRKLSRRHQLEEHIRVHVDPGAFKCELCGKCCTNKRTLSNHMYEQHTEQGQEKSFECPICHKCFAKKPVWKRHMEIHQPNKDHVCTECGKGFPTEQRRIVHQRMVHNVERVCDQCGKTFRGIYTLRIHLQEHAGIERKKWPCDQCSAKLNTHASLKRHKLVAHNDGSIAYICSECGKVAPSAIALLSHKKYVHQAQRKYKCTICDKAFKTNLVLREHMASHTGEDLYTCPHCPKTFKVSSNMHHHRKKAHPVEWAAAKSKRPMTASIDLSQVSQEIVM